MLEVIKDTLIDGVKLLPFLFIAYLIMEYLEHKTGKKTKNIIKKSGKLGPLWGGILGIFPQCGFSAAAANLYTGKIITLGTLIAVFLSTSDEMLPILISENTPIAIILQILGIKLLIGIIAGFIIDFVERIIKNRKSNKNNEKVEKNKNDVETEIKEEIGHVCEHEHCHCEKEGILKSSIKHTLSIFAFIVIITFILNTVIYFIGEEKLSNLVLNMPVIGPMISGLIGLIPNCAGSVILTQLYLQKVISMGSIISGLLVGSGIGILILFRVNKNIKENLKILGILYAIGVISGIIIDFVCTLV